MTRRRFLCKTAAAVTTSFLLQSEVSSSAAVHSDTAAPPLTFETHGNEFIFDTGDFGGTLRRQGQSRGLIPLVEHNTGRSVARSAGIFSHYRLLDSETRFGTAGWDWPSKARLVPDGSVLVNWTADGSHPFDMSASYRWVTPNMLDLTTTVTAHKSLKKLEVFLASYFEGFPEARVYAKSCEQTEGQTGFLEAKKVHGVWQMFPRDADAVPMIQDGRWQRPPHPVDWTIMPQLAAPLAMRRDAATGLVGLVMAHPQDCFAIATPYNAETHRSLYLSLFGTDFDAGQAATARTRLVIQRGISDEQAVQLYQAFLSAPFKTHDVF